MSKKAKEKKEAFIKRIKEVKLGYAYSYTSLYCLSFWHLTENTIFDSFLITVVASSNSFPEDFKEKSKLYLLVMSLSFMHSVP